MGFERRWWIVDVSEVKKDERGWMRCGMAVEAGGCTVERMRDPGFFFTKPFWDWDWVNYSRPGRVR